MSVKLMSLVFETSLPPTPRLVMLALADHSDNEGNSCYPGINLLATKCGLSRRQVFRVVNDLESGGWITVIRRGSEGETNIYKLNIEQIKGDKMTPPRGDKMSPQGVTKCHGRGDAHVTGGGDTSVTGGVTPMSPKPSINHQLNQKNSTPSAQGAKARAAGARKITPDWQPDEAARRWITSFGITVEQAAPVIQEFREYWLGRSTRRKDWSLAFRRNSRAEGSLIRLQTNIERDRHGNQRRETRAEAFHRQLVEHAKSAEAETA